MISGMLHGSVSPPRASGGWPAPKPHSTCTWIYSHVVHAQVLGSPGPPGCGSLARPLGPSPSRGTVLVGGSSSQARQRWPICRLTAESEGKTSFLEKPVGR